MSPTTGQRGPAAALAGAVLLGGVCLAGCTGATTSKKPAPTVTGSMTAGGTGVDNLMPRGTAPAGTVAGSTLTGKAALDSFIAGLRPGAATSFEAEYIKAGRKIVYAVRPPGDLLFRDTALVRGKGRQIVVNGSGEYLCRSPGHARWACQKLDQASAAVRNKVFAIYTAAHWAAFLEAYAPAAGANSATFTTSLNVAGMRCLDFSPPGTHGIDVVCTVAPGVLGLVTYHTTSFMMESFDPSPPASLFMLPPGAKIGQN
jgi:hypothetical protein